MILISSNLEIAGIMGDGSVHDGVCTNADTGTETDRHTRHGVRHVVIYLAPYLGAVAETKGIEKHWPVCTGVGVGIPAPAPAGTGRSAEGGVSGHRGGGDGRWKREGGGRAVS